MSRATPLVFLTLRLALGVSLIACLCLITGRVLGAYLPHGSILVYSAATSGGSPPLEYAIYIVDVERSLFARLRTPQVDIGVDPTCSVNGQVAFASAEGSDFWNANDIYVVDIFGGNATLVTHNFTNNHWLRWSPDGKHLAFVYGSGYWLGDYLYVVDPTADAPQAVVENDEIVAPPIWSPDSRQLLYMSLRYHDTYITAVTLGENNPHRLTDSVYAEMSPSWSPDGKSIVFASNRENGYDLYVMDSDGGHLRPLTQSNGDEYFPVWSPDGKSIAFTASEFSRIQLMLMDADGANPRLLADGMPSGVAPAWSPDGQYLAFVTGRELQYRDIMLVRADGHDQRRLVTTPTSYLSLEWCP